MPGKEEAMKTYTELTPEQQAKAVDKATVNILTAILEGSLRFDDAKNGDDLQARIDTACARAEEMQTPWFAHEYIMGTCRDDIEGMAQCDAESSLYLEAGEFCIAGIA